MKRKEKQPINVALGKDFVTITINEPVTLKIPRYHDDRKLLAVLLSFFQNRTGNNCLTQQQISNALGYNNRNDTFNHIKEFKARGSNMEKFLARKVVLEKHVEPIQRHVLKNLYLEPADLYKTYDGKGDMTDASFYKYLAQTNTYVILRAFHKQIDENTHYWKDEGFVSYLAKNVDNSVVKKKIEIINETINPPPPPEKKPNSAHTEESVDISMEKKKIETINEAKVPTPQTPKKNQNLSLSTLQKSLLVMFLVGCNISFETIGFLLGMSKSYVYKLVHNMPDFSQELLSSIAQNTKVVCVDEKYIKYKGRFLYVFSAVDFYTGIPLLIRVYKERTVQNWQRFFAIFKIHYGKVKCFITDGCPVLKKGRELVYPKTPHQYCKFHKMKNLIKRIFEYEPNPVKQRKMIDKLKKVFSRDTVGGRRNALIELERMLDGNLKLYFDEHIKKEWKHLTKSLTSNAAERFNREIKKIVSGKYGQKSPETIEMLMTCLWFKTLIMRGQAQLSKESTIAKINISKICQELLVNKRMEELFKDATNNEAA